MRFPISIGIILLAICLILMGVSVFAAAVIPAILLGILAIAVGVLLLIGRR